MVLLALATAITGEARLLFLPWNLFLAWVPYALSLGAWCTYLRGGHTRIWLLPLSLVWLLFLPNAPYIVTDLVHLENVPPAWTGLYTVVLAAFAVAAVLLGLASLRIMHAILDARVGPRASWVVLAVVFVLTGIGIYVGRIVRWNSWDVFSRPELVVRSTLEAIAQCCQQGLVAFLSFGAGVVFMMSYLLYAALGAPRRATE